MSRQNIFTKNKTVRGMGTLWAPTLGTHGGYMHRTHGGWVLYVPWVHGRVKKQLMTVKVQMKIKI